MHPLLFGCKGKKNNLVLYDLRLYFIDFQQFVPDVPLLYQRLYQLSLTICTNSQSSILIPILFRRALIFGMCFIVTLV